jgi:hypothetical protein
MLLDLDYRLIDCIYWLFYDWGLLFDRKLLKFALGLDVAFEFAVDDFLSVWDTVVSAFEGPIRRQHLIVDVLDQHHFLEWIKRLRNSIPVVINWAGRLRLQSIQLLIQAHYLLW